MLALQEERYSNGEKHLSRFDMIKLLMPLKKQPEYDWLNEVSNASLCRVCTDLDNSYKEFFKKSHGHPKFKSKKKSKRSYPVVDTKGKTYFKDGFVHIQKVGNVKYKTDFILPQGNNQKLSNPRITQTRSGKWMLSVGIECESQAPKLTDKAMGIDLGVKEQAVVAYGDEQIVFHNINKSKRMRLLNKQLKHTQRSISRKYEASRKRTGRYEKTNNIMKAEVKARQLQERISNIRNNYIHQITHKLTSLLPYKVVMEDLNVQGMMKNKHLARAISEQNFYKFTRQMRYKCEWNGIEFVQVDRFYPSSKTCSHCGAVKQDLKLSDRVFKCDCGLEIDRDYNAAINLARYAA